jgi:hypothetical protein
MPLSTEMPAPVKAVRYVALRMREAACVMSLRISLMAAVDQLESLAPGMSSALVALKSAERLKK